MNNNSNQLHVITIFVFGLSSYLEMTRDLCTFGYLIIYNQKPVKRNVFTTTRKGTLSSSSRRVYDTARQLEHLSNKNLKANK